MYVLIHVAPGDAVRAGKAQSGDIKLPLTEEILASLTDAQRDYLAGSLAVDGDRYSLSWPGVSEATPETLKQIIDGRISDLAAEKAKDAAKKAKITEETLAVLRERKTSEAYGYRCNYLGIYAAWPYERDYAIANSPEALAWQAELDAENKRRASEASARQASRKAAEEAAKAEEEAAAEKYALALAEGVRQWGQPSDVERLDAGFLAEAEQEKIVRNHLFAALAGQPRYERLTNNDVCCDSCYESSVEYETADAETLTVEQWAALKAIRAKLSDGMEATPRLHVGKCSNCEEKTERYSIRVTTTWHGKEYALEYALEV